MHSFKKTFSLKFFWQEIALLSRLRHPNIVQYYGSKTVSNLCSILLFHIIHYMHMAIVILAFHIYLTSLSFYIVEIRHLEIVHMYKETAWKEML